MADSEPGRADHQRDLSISYSKLGMLALEKLDLEQAAQYLEEDLRIAVELAQREPQRADLVVDVAISLRLAGQLRADRARLERAIVILRHLDEQGRLPPNGAGLLQQLEDDTAAL